MAKKKAKAKAKKAARTTTKKAEHGKKRGKRPSSFCIMADMGPGIGVRVIEVGLKDSTSGWKRIQSLDFITDHPNLKNCPLRVFASAQRESLLWECKDATANQADLTTLRETLENTTNSTIREGIEVMIQALEVDTTSCKEGGGGFLPYADQPLTPTVPTSSVADDSDDQEPHSETPEQEPIATRDVGGDDDPSEVSGVPSLVAVPPEASSDLPQPPPPPPFVSSGDEGV